MSTTLLMNKADKSHKQIMIIGVGNRLLGDEGVGLHIIDKLSQIPIPPYVNIVDCGCDLLNLMAYIKKPKRIIIIDAIRAGGEPGEIYSFDFSKLTTTKVDMCSAHQIKTIDALRLIKLVCPALSDSEIVVIGIEPKVMQLSSDLSKEVSESITEAMRFVLEEISLRFFPWHEEKGVFSAGLKKI
jgi:hydrogenase maturation protease